MTSVAATWSSAVATCEMQHAYLATMTSIAQNRWLFEYFRSQALTSVDIWIGANDISKEGTFQWIDGSGNTSHFHYWSASQPDNSGGNENCMVWRLGYNGQWNDIYCGNSFTALCKWNPTKVVVPQGSD